MTRSSPVPRSRRVLPANVFDALELSALAYGGIGRKAYDEYDEAGDNPIAPRCALGHAAWVLDDPYHMTENVGWFALNKIGIQETENDEAVKAINRRRGRSDNARVSFNAWRRELGVERGS